jgi:hypothetical protein
MVAALHRRERHRDRPAERAAQVYLWKIGVALDERIGRGEEGADERQLDGQLVGQQHEQEGKRCERDENADRFCRRHLAGRDGAVLGAPDLDIEFAVGVVVDRASGRAHQEHAEGKDDQAAPRRKIAGCQPQCPPGRPQ